MYTPPRVTYTSQSRRIAELEAIATERKLDAASLAAKLQERYESWKLDQDRIKKLESNLKSEWANTERFRKLSEAKSPVVNLDATQYCAQCNDYAKKLDVANERVNSKSARSSSKSCGSKAGLINCSIITCLI